MRIPDETIFRFFEQKKRQSPSGENGIEPVDHLAPSRDALSREQPQPDEKLAENTLDEQKRKKSMNPEGGKERRRHDRRQKQQDVLLDTRTNSSRRRSAQHPVIDVKA